MHTAMIRSMIATGFACAALVRCSSGGDDAAAPTGTAAGTRAETAAPEVRDITASVSGRMLDGRCVGAASGAPTVVLEVDMGGRKDHLMMVQDHLVGRAQVCTYDRAGQGASDTATTPRPVEQVVDDLHAFLTAAAPPPYFLVGHSFGGEIAHLYAQAHPDRVAGFVSMNPSVPNEPWLTRIRTVETEAQVREFELPYLRGENDEGIDFRDDETALTDPLPADLPYAVIFGQSCAEFPPPLMDVCPAILGLLDRTSRELSEVGEGGRFVRAAGSGHYVYRSHPDLVLATIDRIWKEGLRR